MTSRTPLRAFGAALALVVPAFLVSAAPASSAPDAGGGADDSKAAGSARAAGASGARSAEPAAGPRSTLPAPPQMRKLAPLIGSWRCIDNPEPGTPRTVMYVKTQRSMDGHYVTIDAKTASGDLHGRTVWGWNPVDKNYIGQYHDDWGTSSTTTSPGWQDGHLKFKGPLVQVAKPDPAGDAEGAHMDLVDDYTVVGKHHFKVRSTVSLKDGQAWVHDYDCRRK
ncbi:DUF1579 family protein [Streptomyces boncukensis]|uniref:DUF1579 domain-containing protein n=1 Tax=Streptomyces boncukensis TaxID=2711219 RepID=A0A6G4X5Z3_9ACTN|nr:DUF1579 family protein [Streptomyces boncukensis]NGO72956.1 DUF1579 domain-containing protein [Streptomyces boncukensis]